ncbi:glycosyl transferase family 90-domain-containing protein [Hygrophoropsis aurantiaca]|uniref:Glycosyl transferase family 90-domain-containing protein n=1 Tax=Hygrophoropsis aurantiaca TaxID=72124 RepID=A0ACB8AI72_9AGAM|nr:glycosyl transferase family 90-domain-containing protein [Hygrophoropsis aurantiaca]
MSYHNGRAKGPLAPRILSYKSGGIFILVCIIAITLRNFYFAPTSPSPIKIVSPVDIEIPLSPPPVASENVAQNVELGTHYYGDDGLLVVNPDGPHPVFELIKNAEAKWSSKLSRASKTLDEAIAEYKRRYRRSPPLHFDLWWNYVTEHNVQLPDEYDDIYRDLEPFWGIHPEDLRRTQAELETRTDVVTVEKVASAPQINLVNTSLPADRYDELLQTIYNIIDLMGDIEHQLLPFRATFSPHDNPSMLSDYRIKSMALEAAAKQTTVRASDLPKDRHVGWVEACSPSSPARQKEIDLDHPPARSNNKTFITDHRLSMDPCLHPSHLYQHGQFLSHNYGPFPQTTLVPRFSLCSTLVHHDLRPVVPHSWVEDIFPKEDNPPWDEKHDERLVWRGSNTGIYHGPDTRWRTSHRERLVHFANANQGSADVLKSPLLDNVTVGAPQDIPRAYLNPALFDVEFADHPTACEPEICKILEEEFDYRRRQSVKQAGSYKYVLDIDGNGWSGRFKRLITSNSLVFKATIYPEWFMDRIQPWAHYIPVQMDLSDLHDSLVFFRGGPGGEGAHDDHAQKIASAGRQWSKHFWRREDMTAYMFRLFLEYARVSSLDRDALTYKEHSPKQTA